MIAQSHGSLWATLSDDLSMRYLLAQRLSDEMSRACTFIMLNPSTADAFKPDPTFTECVKRARFWKCDTLYIVNLFALRTPKPSELKRAKDRGADADADRMIETYTKPDALVVCAWGNDGWLDGRDKIVADRLQRRGVELHHLGLTQNGRPKHPLARGVHRIPSDIQPIRWTP